MPVRLDRSRLLPALSDRDALDARVLDAHRRVLAGETRSPEMLGWRTMLDGGTVPELDAVREVADEIRDRADVLLCVGIGGSYLGAEAVMQALTPTFARSGPEVLFAGHHLGAVYLDELFDYLDGKSVYVNVISKSGTTLEPALAFRHARTWLAERFDDADRRIVATTDGARGTLHRLAADAGWRTFTIPDSVGGRFSVLTPVGLLPVAVAGVDVRALVAGAAREADALAHADASHPALLYAGDRFALHQSGTSVEILAVMDPRLRGLGAWWQQLFGESEGKDGQGLFPVVLQYTTDLHSVGQYVQDGRRMFCETFLRLADDADGPVAGTLAGDPDGLNDLAGVPLGTVNARAWQGTAEAHAEGGVPNWTLTLDRLDADAVGHLLYWYQHAVAVGGTLLGVDPFNQPGVEAYKQKMYALLGR